MTTIEERLYFQPETKNGVIKVENKMRKEVDSGSSFCFLQAVSDIDADPGVVLYRSDDDTGTTCGGDGGSEGEHKHHKHNYTSTCFPGKAISDKAKINVNEWDSVTQSL